METLTLQAETSQLLELVIHSLYTHREIFLRELVANASDAIDRFRVESLAHPEWDEPTTGLEIRLEVDPAARTLTIRDNGIGMSRAEVVSHIGTIAKSGTREFRAQVDATQGQDQALALIGRFGVGFYSSFMVADRVTLVTRRAGEQAGTRWESSGTIAYTLSDADDLPRGTAVTLHLKPVDAEEGREDFTDRWVLSRVIQHYADFVTHPIVYESTAAEPKPEATPDQEPDQAAEKAPERIVLNSMKPIWTRSPSEVTADEYDEFYKHVAHDWTAPLLRLPIKAEGRWECTGLLFVPSHAPHDLFYHGGSFGLQLYSQRMLIVENCQELAPRYLRFLKGVVDAMDLPLNVSRQSLQHAQHLTTIRKWLTKKVLDSLAKLREGEPEKYLTFWQQFGRAIKEGVSEDKENAERLTPLLLFESSADATKLTTLAEYVARMTPGQKDIYYLSGESRTLIERSPHLERLRGLGYEVLYFSEPVDELMVQALPEFEGHRLRSAAKGQMELGDDAERERAQAEVKQETERLSGLIAFIGKHLEGRVREVRVSNRLTVSPACLTGDEFGFSPHVQRLLSNSPGMGARRVLELNPHHAIVTAMHRRFGANGDDPLVPATADLLFGIALLAEGSPLPDAPAFNARLGELLSAALEAPAVATES